MTLTKLQKDVQAYTFNEGQITLIDNVLSTNYQSLDELVMMLRAWSIKMQEAQKEIDKKYEGLK